MYWHPRIHRACHLRPASVSTARKKQSRLSRLSVLESWNTAATAERSGAMSLVIPKNRSMKCDESADEQQFHTMTRSRRAVSILSIPKQSRHLLPSSERSRASPMGCPPSRCSVTGFRVAPRQKRPAADTRSRLQTMGGLTLGGTIKIKRSKKKRRVADRPLRSGF